MEEWNMNTYELNNGQRISRAVVGTGLILYTMSLPVSPLGLFALLPLIATYPIFTGMFGFDPIAGFIKLEISRLVDAITHHHGGHHPHHR
jgi:hypothetical protein